MRVPVSVLDRIRDGLHGLSKAERRVADIILADLDRATRLSIKELAQEAQTSEPTVLRLARRVGCEGFPDLKRRVSQDVAIERMFVFPSHDFPPRTAEEVAMKVYDASAQALAYAFSQRDPSALENAALAIVAAPRVFSLWRRRQFRKYCDRGGEPTLSLRYPCDSNRRPRPTEAGIGPMRARRRGPDLFGYGSTAIPCR